MDTKKSEFQINRSPDLNIYDIPYYNTIKKFLQFLGLDPNQSNDVRAVIVTVMVISTIGVIIPMSIDVYVSLRKKDLESVIECLPHIFSALISLVKLLNVYLHRKNFTKMFGYITKGWEQLRLNGELHVLEKITSQGTKMAQVYRNTLLAFMVVFILAPLIFPVLDIILPLNETRPRLQMLKVNYLIFDADEYFFSVYVQLSWGTFVVVTIIVTVDSLYMIIIHHSSGLFAVVGHKVQEATGSYNANTTDVVAYQQVRKSIISHNKAIEFYDLLNESSRTSYLLQVGISMMNMSVTAVQTVLCLDRPEEALRSALLLGAEQFHLFMLSLPGQILVDNCIELENAIYSSTWYKTPVKVQKLLYTMKIRSQKWCVLTAAGLYEMNIENFGTTFKTCMSYFTMIMSLQE